ncbi:MAG: dihydrodipicolinate synthase family protein, partial [Deltaproteobacteria bacterium]|nr:dihydrodipicolinate synthase family protein [Deltaproteobacteria bacterium]
MTELISEDSKGVYVISATPFDDIGIIDYDSADSLVEYYIDKKVSGMTILGMMGEAVKMSVDEAQTFITY